MFGHWKRENSFSHFSQSLCGKQVDHRVCAFQFSYRIFLSLAKKDHHPWTCLSPFQPSSKTSQILHKNCIALNPEFVKGQVSDTSGEVHSGSLHWQEALPIPYTTGTSWCNNVTHSLRTNSPVFHNYRMSESWLLGTSTVYP